MGPEAQAAAEAAAAAVANSEAEKTAVIVDAVVEAAQERVEQAEATAQAITEAALENERGRRIEAVENEVGQCRMEISNLRAALESLQTEITSIMAAPPQIAVINPPPAKSSSIPPNMSGQAETTTVETVTVEPGSESAGDQKVPEMPALPVRRRRLI